MVLEWLVYGKSILIMREIPLILIKTYRFNFNVFMGMINESFFKQSKNVGGYLVLCPKRLSSTEMSFT